MYCETPHNHLDSPTLPFSRYEPFRCIFAELPFLESTNWLSTTKTIHSDEQVRDNSVPKAEKALPQVKKREEEEKVRGEKVLEMVKTTKEKVDR